MKKMMQTILLAGFVILTTASFSYAQFSATGSTSFPYFHLGCLIVGGMIIISLKRKYTKIYFERSHRIIRSLCGFSRSVHRTGG